MVGARVKDPSPQHWKRRCGRRALARRRWASASKKAQKRDPAKISGPCASPTSRRGDARRCGGAMGRGVVRRAQDDGAIAGVVSFLIERHSGAVGYSG